MTRIPGANKVQIIFILHIIIFHNMYFNGTLGD